MGEAFTTRTLRDGVSRVVVGVFVMCLEVRFRFLTAFRCSVMTLLISTAIWTVDGFISRMGASVGGVVSGGGVPRTRSTFHVDVRYLRSKFRE